MKMTTTTTSLTVCTGDTTDTLFRVIETGKMAGQVFLTGTVAASTGSYSIHIRVRDDRIKTTQQFL